MKLRNKIIDKFVTKALTVLGICSTAFVFMACYGPTPKGYAVADDEDSLVVATEEGDTLTLSTDANDTAEATTADDGESAE
ncbi:MAG: hypothetical protein IJ200_11670 [Prevotella sp.]|nr:hypothetical protein [Prevotella sp.]